MGTCAPADRLTRYVQDAARLRLEIIPYEDDLDSASSSVSTIYAVDTNVVALFLRPNEEGPRSEGGGGGYGQIFFDDARESTETLGAVLSRFVFFDSVEQGAPLVLLPGHDAEVRGMYEAVVRDATSAENDVERERDGMEAWVEKIESIESVEQQVSYVQEIAPNLLSYLFFGNDKARQLSQFNRLLSERRVSRLSHVSDRAGQLFSIPELQVAHASRALQAPSNFQEQMLESAYRVAWFERLRASNSARAEYRIRPDAAALARLELVNRQLKGTKCRLALITGDEAMFRAAQDYFPGSESEGSFAVRFLRHPRAFLAADKVVLSDEALGRHTDQSAPTFVVDWLDTLLARYSNDGGMRLQTLRELAEGDGPNYDRLRAQSKAVVRRDARACERIAKEWREHVADLRSRHVTSSEIGRREFSYSVEDLLRARARPLLDAIDAQLAERSKESWKEFFEALMVAGYELLFDDSGPSGMPRRNPPPVLFDVLTAANQFVRELARAGGITGLEEGEFRQLLQAVDGQDDSGYSQALAFALAFAHAERWHVTSLLANRAIAIAEGIVEQGGEQARAGCDAKRELANSRQAITGREAYYLCAVALRLRARSADEIDRVDALLASADLARMKDQQRGSGPEASTSPHRFFAERLALALESQLLHVFKKVQFDGLHRLQPLDVLFAEFDRAFGSLDDAVLDDWVRAHLRRKLATNVFMTVALIEFSGQPLPNDIESRCRAQLNELLHERAGQDEAIIESITPTRLVSAVTDYAQAKFGTPTPAERGEIMNRVKRLRTDLDENPQAVVVAEYDRARYGALANLTFRQLTKLSVPDQH